MWHVEHVMYSTEIRMVDNVLSPILYMTLHTMVYLCMSGGGLLLTTRSTMYFVIRPISLSSGFTMVLTPGLSVGAFNPS